MSTIPSMYASFQANPLEFVRWVKDAMPLIIEVLDDDKVSDAENLSAASHLRRIAISLSIRIQEEDWIWANEIAEAVGDINKLDLIDYSGLNIGVNIAAMVIESANDLSGLRWLNEQGFNWKKSSALLVQTAAIKGSSDLRELKWLLSVGCPADDLNKTNMEGHSIHDEVDLARLEALWELGLRSKPTDFSAPRKNLLHRMALHGCSVDFFRVLINDAGLSPDSKGNSPLHYCESPELAQELLAAGCDPNAVNHKKETPYFMIAMLGLENDRQTPQKIIQTLELIHNAGGRANNAIKTDAVDTEGRPILQSVFGFFEDHVASNRWHSVSDLLLIAETFWRHGYRPHENEAKSHWRITNMLIERYDLEKNADKIRRAKFQSLADTPNGSASPSSTPSTAFHSRPGRFT